MILFILEIGQARVGHYGLAGIVLANRSIEVRGDDTTVQDWQAEGFSTFANAV